MSDSYIYSTLSASVRYGTDDGQRVLVAGGANVPSKHMVTSAGVATRVTQTELEIIQKDPAFKIHRENGFVRVESQKHDVEKVVVDMARADESAPDTESDAAANEKRTGVRTRAGSK